MLILARIRNTQSFKPSLKVQVDTSEKSKAYEQSLPIRLNERDQKFDDVRAQQGPSSGVSLSWFWER